MSPRSATSSERRKPSSRADSPRRASDPLPKTTRVRDWKSNGSNMQANGTTLFFLGQCEKLVAVRDVERAVGRDGAAVDGAAHVHLGQHLLLLPGLHDDHVAVLVAEVELAVHEQGRAPDGREHVVRPVDLARLG